MITFLCAPTSFSGHLVVARPVSIFAIFVLLTACGNAGPSAGGEATQGRSNDQYNAAIQQILSADEELGATRNHACEDTTLSVTIKRYVAGIDALDFSDCPADFTAAFRRHRDAWAASVGFFGQFDTLRGEMHELFAAIENGKKDQQRAYDQALQPITDTWIVVDSLARRYEALAGESPEGSE